MIYVGQHFVVYYDLLRDAYFIKDLGVGFGTFVRLDRPLPLKNNYLILIGSNFILVTLVENKLKLKVFGVASAGDVYYFNAHEDSVVSIGRKPTCDVHVSDSLASKMQAWVQFAGDWVLHDGDCSTFKPSTNGTWLYLSEGFEVYSGMTFKAIHTLFEAELT